MGCASWIYTDCQGQEMTKKCNLIPFSNRQWISNLKEAKLFCKEGWDASSTGNYKDDEPKQQECFGITRHNGGYEIMTGGPSSHESAHELWLCEDTPNGHCASWSYIDCRGEEMSKQCALVPYSERNWISTLEEAKEKCTTLSDCCGITHDNNGYEPRKGCPTSHIAAHELWICDRTLNDLCLYGAMSTRASDVSFDTASLAECVDICMKGQVLQECKSASFSITGNCYLSRDNKETNPGKWTSYNDPDPGSLYARKWKYCNTQDPEIIKFMKELNSRADMVWDTLDRSHDTCPASHPFAYYYGNHCCKYNQEKVEEWQGEACDGGIISLQSLCCKNNDGMPCPSASGLCKNYGAVVNTARLLDELESLLEEMEN